jgi:hypothetical protein
MLMTIILTITLVVEAVAFMLMVPQGQVELEEAGAGLVLTHA